MGIDLELREIIDDVIKDSVDEKCLRAQYETWLEIKERNYLNSFRDFVIGDLNGFLRVAYATYNGMKGSDLNDDESSHLNNLLIRKIYGLEPIIEKVIHNKNI
ncbi:hypothetical protein GF319_12600 [Candidatus Bathyarchaeota archaeon]|nr:hypothetical protein [Candidatus Bathyarchaeota archaeon]